MEPTRIERGIGLVVFTDSTIQYTFTHQLNISFSSSIFHQLTLTESDARIDTHLAFNALIQICAEQKKIVC